MGGECERVRGRLPEMVAGDLSADEADAVRRHLARCPGCRRARRRVAAVLEAASRLRAPPVPEQFAECVMGRAAGGPRPLRQASRWPAVAAAAGLLLAVSAVLLTRGQREEPTPPVPREGEARVEAFVTGLDGAARRAGRTGTGALAVFADAGRQVLAARPGGARPAATAPREADLSHGASTLAEGLEEAVRTLGRALGDLEARVPWL